MEKTYYQVPFVDKDLAKKIGAKWDNEKKCWFADTQEVSALLRKRFKEHKVDPAPITVLPGEDRTFGGNRLFIDLVPQSCWFTNVRYCVAEHDWERLSKGVRSRANQACEACTGKADPEHGIYLEAHERWSYDDDTGVQKLQRLVCLCTACHRTTHYGLSQLRGEEERVREHYMAVNDCSEEQLDRDVREAFEVWQERNAREWDLDLSIITDAGISLRRPVAKQERSHIADDLTDQVRSEEVDENFGGVVIREITQEAAEALFDNLMGLPSGPRLR